MNKEDLLKLKDDITKNQISPDIASSILFSVEKRSWHTKEWKEKRNIIIKDKCEQCSNTEVLTLQHTWHPRKYRSVKNEVCEKYKDLIVHKFPIGKLVLDEEVLGKYTSLYYKSEKEICPNCGSNNISARKSKLPRYRCNTCKFEFEEPEVHVVPFFIDDRKQEPLLPANTVFYSVIAEKIYNEKVMKLLYEEFENQIGVETLCTIIDEYIRYIELIDTVTLCRKCAFLYDRKGMNLCPKCKVTYKKIYQEECSKCSGLDELIIEMEAIRSMNNK